ncbi:MAG: photosystem I assembly protein Ycf4 [Leptolyngbyaceae bacterium]|nr:photosystem I assembly protein Ycf4 [Leptolyngbyaceae bacterium]
MSNKNNESRVQDMVFEQKIVGARRLSNYWWASVVLVGGIGFSLASLSSYLHVNLLPFSSPTELVFIPQGVAMGFYGLMALLLSSYLWVIIALNVGGGYNRFDKERGIVKIFRWGFLGKDRIVDVEYPLEDVRSIRAEIREGLNPKRALYLNIKGSINVPISQVGRPMALADLENQGAALARFLNVPLEGL